MKIPLALFFAILLGFDSAYGQGSNLQVYCGRRLADVMAIVCEKYQPERKRSIYESLLMRYEPEHRWGLPWIAATRTGGGHAGLKTGLVGFEEIGGHRGLPNRNLGTRGKRGIVYDCCENPCSLETLLAYC